MWLELLLGSVNFFQNFVSEASEDEVWFPHWLMADICPGASSGLCLYLGTVTPGHGRGPRQKAE